MSATLRSIHAKHALLVAVAFVGAIPYGWHAAWSLAAGGAIQALNLAVLERSVRRMIGSTDSTLGGGTAGGRILALARFGLLLGSVAWILSRTSVEPLPLLVGLSMLVPAVAWHGIAEANRGI